MNYICRNKTNVDPYKSNTATHIIRIFRTYNNIWVVNSKATLKHQNKDQLKEILVGLNFEHDYISEKKNEQHIT